MTEASRFPATSDNAPNESAVRREGPRRGYRSRCGARRGAAVVEFAIVASLLFLLILGIIEFGRLLMVQQILTNASREGARRAVLEQATVTDVETLVDNYLASSSVPGATVTVSPSSLSTLGFGDPVTVSVSVPYNQVSWLPSPWFLGGRVLSAESVMRAERAQ